MKSRITITTILALLFASIRLFGQTIYVNSNTGNDATGDGTSGNPYKTFHKGYTMASAGGTIDLTGTFTWTDADETGDVATTGYTIAKNIIIQGQSAATTTIQAAATQSSANCRVFTISTGSSATFNDVTIRYGNFTDAVSYSFDGGGGIKTRGTLTMNKCYVTRNNVSGSAGKQGGGVLIEGSNTTTTITNCDFTYNVAGSTYGLGGGIAKSNYESGQAVGPCYIRNTTFNNNTAQSEGSGFFCYQNSNSVNELTNCTFIYNTGGSFGSIWFDRSPGIVTNCTVINNGGGLVHYANTVHIKNNIMANNTGWDCKIVSSGTIVDNGYNIVEVSSGYTVAGTSLSGDQPNLNISSTLADNSTFNQSQTLSLLAGSVAINAGGTGSNSTVTVPCKDQRGYFKNSTKDIGAFEYDGLTSGAPSVTLSTTALTGFFYYEGAGPSEQQSFTISGSNLMDNIVITPQSNYEISNGGAFSTSITLTQSGGNIAQTTLYVRLKAGNFASAYNNRIMTIISTCLSESVSCSGTVAPVPSNTRIWTGNTSTVWSTPTNWAYNTIPTSVYHALIPTGRINYPIVGNAKASPAVCNNLTLQTGATLTVSEDKAITVSGNIDNSGTITVKSNTTGDGSILVTGTITGTGTYNIERYLAASKWHLVSSPITAGLSGVFQNIWLRPYDEATNTFGAYIVPTTIPMPTGQGFSVWTNSVNEIRTFSGLINHGAVTPSVQLTGAAGPSTGWNLIGNPYPSAIDWNAASGWTKTNIGSTIYVWNNNQYATWNGSVGTNGGSRYVAMEQGFFVQASAAGAAISMNNSVRLHNSVAYMKTVNEDPSDIIRVKVSINNNSDETVIALNNNGSDNFNFETDAVKLPGNTNSPQMHTIKNNNSPLAISTLSAPENVVEKYVYIDYAETGTHQLLFTHTLTGNYIPRLYDNVKQTIVEPNTPYSFNASVGDASTRFQFVESAPLSVNNTANNADLTIWESSKMLYIINSSDEQIKQVRIYSIDGKLVHQGNQSTADLKNLSSGVYIVKVITTNKTQIKKITIK